MQYPYYSTPAGPAYQVPVWHGAPGFPAALAAAPAGPALAGPAFAGAAGAERQPRVDIYRHEDSYRVYVDLPGLDEDRLNLSWAGDALIVQGSWPEATASEQPVYRERPAGPFSRRIPLPADADAASASASLREGTLEVTVHAHAAGEGRTIRIEGKH